ncbi:MAG: hypothetical protein ACM3ML_16650 [Micromonosporaceae bacterium]
MSRAAADPSTPADRGRKGEAWPRSGYFATQSWVQKNPNTAHAFQRA